MKTFEQKRSFFACQSVRHGIQYEDEACALFLEINKFDESPVGLIVNYQIPFLGASPDSLTIENEEIKLLEVKCPYSVFSKKVQASKGSRFKQILYKKRSVLGNILCQTSMITIIRSRDSLISLVYLNVY